MEYKDYYQILGLERSASEEAIKKAYRKLARKHHPDVNPGDTAAEERFKDINEAYQVLRDPEKRRKYDQFGSQWQQYRQSGGRAEDFNWGEWGARPGGEPGQGYRTRQVSPEEFEQMFGGQGGFSDFFETLFGGAGRQRTAGFGFEDERAWQAAPQGRDIEHPIEITLEEAFHGARRTLQRSDGSRIEAQIPAGVQDGARVRLRGQGQPVPGGQSGNLYLKIHIVPHPRFQRQGDDLQVSQPVDLYTLVLGGEVAISSLDKTVTLTIPPETQSGTPFRLRGLGMPKAGDPAQRGDLFAKVQARLPQNLSPQEQRLFAELRALRQPGGT
ncbi:MAG: DnaJ C-terminal domain-containing protein [Chloroflexota bacterium]